MLGGLLAVVLLAAPEPGSAGSVEGPFAWVDLHGAFQTGDLNRWSNPVLPHARGPSSAAQVQLFGGWGVPLGNQRLALTAAVHGALVPGAYLSGPYFGGYALRQVSQLQLSPLQLGASLPVRLGELAVVPMLALSVPTAGLLDSGPTVLTLAPRLEVQVRMAELFLVGVAASLAFPLLEPARDQVRCDRDAAGCRILPRERWRGSLRLQGELFVHPALSVVQRVDLDLRDEYARVPVRSLTPASLMSPTALINERDLGARTLEVRPAVDLVWSFTDHFGLTLSVAVSARFLTYTPQPDVDLTLLTPFQAGLSVWFRSDARLQRAWLER